MKIITLLMVVLIASILALAGALYFSKSGNLQFFKLIL